MKLKYRVLSTEKEPESLLPTYPREVTREIRFPPIAVIKMPLGRYFLVIGSILFGMLFIAERYSPAATSPLFAEARFDKSIIRVSSAHRWPERIIIDTSLPTLIPPLAEVAAEAPIIDRSPREAFAQASAPVPKLVGNVFPVRTKRKFLKHETNRRMATYQPAEALPAGW